MSKYAARFDNVMTEIDRPIKPPPPIRFEREDERYIRSTFVTLEQLASRCGLTVEELSDWQARGLFPVPTYVTSDGRGWYSAGYAVSVRRARARKTDLHALFIEEFRRALHRIRRAEPGLYSTFVQASGSEEQSEALAAEEQWKDLLRGEWGVCLKTPWVPCMIQKGRLMQQISSLIASPQADSVAWTGKLRKSVDALDRLEQQFAQWDRTRFGRSISRDTYITEVRARFPSVFSRTGNTSAESPIATRGPGESSGVEC